MSRQLLPAFLVFAAMLTACGSETSDRAVTSTTQEAAATDGLVNWRSLGCAEPPELVVPESEASSEDAGLAAPSYAETYDVSIEEAIRRLSLQQGMSERMSQVAAAEGSRVARVEFQGSPYYAGVITLTGNEAVTARTRDLLCSTPDLEVRLGADFSEQELVAEVQRLAPLLFEAFGQEVMSVGPGADGLTVGTRFDSTRDAVEAFLVDETTYPVVVGSLGLPPLQLDGTVPFPLLDTTGLPRAGVGLSGVLLIEGPCAYLNDQLLIFPARETTWDATSGALDTGSGAVFSGEAVVGGGYRYGLPLDELDQRPDPTCRTENGVYFATFSPELADMQAGLPTPPPFPPTPAGGN